MKSLNPTILNIDGERIVKYEDKTYRIKLFEGTPAYTHLSKITKYGSGIFGGVLRGIVDSGEDTNVASMLIAGSLQDAFINIDDPELITWICNELVSSIYVGQDRFNWDKEFVGKGMLICFDLIKQVIQYNFAPLFQELGIAALLNQKEVTE